MTEPIPQVQLLKGKDWKTLIVLDSCRYDYFAELHEQRGWPGKLRPCYSPFTDTALWMNHQLGAIDLEDVIMISGTPVGWAHCRKILNRLFKAEGLWRKGGVDDFPHPMNCMKRAKELMEEHPEKRFFIHLIPPHLPFMGDRGDAFIRRLYRLNPREPIGIRPNIYNDIKKYANTKEIWPEIIEYYKENIEVGMKAVIEADIDNYVITSDHGELVGENRSYCHAAMRLPWLVVQ